METLTLSDIVLVKCEFSPLYEIGIKSHTTVEKVHLLVINSTNFEKTQQFEFDYYTKPRIRDSLIDKSLDCIEGFSVNFNNIYFESINKDIKLLLKNTRTILYKDQLTRHFMKSFVDENKVMFIKY